MLLLEFKDVRGGSFELLLQLESVGIDQGVVDSDLLNLSLNIRLARNNFFQ